MFKKIILFVLLTASLAFSTNYYVDNTASGNNSGSSWENAWESFGNINWNLLSFSDTLFIGGTNYNETLTIQDLSATQGQEIVIYGVNNPHITITSDYAIEIYNNQYVIVQGLKIKEKIKFEGNNYCKVLYIDGTDLVEDGISVRENFKCVVAYSRFYSPQDESSQTDMVYSQDNIDQVYHHNDLRIYNVDEGGHNDCIQMYKDESTIIYNNYIVQDTDKESNSQGIYSTTGYGVHKYYNNVINMFNTQSNALTFRRLPSLGGTGDVEMYNNFVYGDRLYHALYITDVEDPVVKNNIIVSNITDTDLPIIGGVQMTVPTFVDIQDWNGNEQNINYNLYYNENHPNVDPIRLNGSSYSWTEWQNAGFDLNGLNENPMIIDYDSLEIDVNSVVKNKGTGLEPLFDFDFYDTSRPLGIAWDIGPFELPDGTNVTIHNKNDFSYKLEQNYPNPANSTTNIVFFVKSPGEVSVKIYDTLGRLVFEKNEYMSSGKHTVLIDLNNLASGVYLYQINIHNFTQTKKMIILK